MIYKERLLDIIDSDKFLDMPASAQLLFFHFLVRSNENGVITNPKAVIRACSLSAEDIKTLVGNSFLEYPATDGIAITKWNYLTVVNDNAR